MSEPIVESIRSEGLLSLNRNSNRRQTHSRSRPRRTATRKSTRNNHNNTSVGNNVNMGQMLATNSPTTDATQVASQTTYSENNATNNETNNSINNNNNISINGVIGNNEEQEVIAVNNVSCIDLTEDESVVNENSVESDSEIQCIDSIIRNPPNAELCIIRETKRRRTTSRQRSRSPIVTREQSDDIIEITNSQTNDGKTGTNTQDLNNRNYSLRKAIKCPICLDEDSAIQTSGRHLVSTNCGHLFCDRCIKEVIKTSKTCPNCRKKVTTKKSFHPIYL